MRLRHCSLTVFWLLVASAACGDEQSALDRGVSKEVALAAKQVKVVEVTRSDFERQVQSTGSLEPRRQAKLRALVAGPLESIQVDIGDRVATGQELFRTRPVESQLALQSAEASYQTAQANLKDLLAWRRSEEIEVLRAEFIRAQVEHERLAKDAERAQTVFDRGAISASQLEAAGTAAKSAKALMEVAQEQLLVAERGPTDEEIEVARSQVGEAEASVQRVRQTLEDTSVKAPFDGVVTGRWVKAGDYANRGDMVVEVTDLSFLEAEAKLPERYSKEIEVGIPVTVEVISLGTERKGKVIAVNGAIEASTRTFLVKVGVDNTNYSLKANTFSVCDFHVSPLRDALAIPSTAVQYWEGRTFVWIESEGKAHQVDVVLGEMSDGFVQVVRGLIGDESVVVEGAGALTEGDAVSTLVTS